MDLLVLGLSPKQTPGPWELSLESVQPPKLGVLSEHVEESEQIPKSRDVSVALCGTFCGGSRIDPQAGSSLGGLKDSFLANLGNIKVSSFPKVDSEVPTACPLMSEMSMDWSRNVTVMTRKTCLNATSCDTSDKMTT